MSSRLRPRSSQDHRQGAPGRPAADHGRTDGAQHGPVADRMGRARPLQCRDDRCEARGDRQGGRPCLFREAMAHIGLETPKSRAGNATDIKDHDRKSHEAERSASKAKLSGDETRQGAGRTRKPSGTWAKAIASRYVNHAMAIAAQALDDVGLPASSGRPSRSAHRRRHRL